MLTLLEKQNSGLCGSVTYGAGAVTGQDFCRLHCLQVTTLTGVTDALNSTDAALLTALPAGTILYGKFSAFTVGTSGLVRAYKSFAPTTIS